MLEFFFILFLLTVIEVVVVICEFLCRENEEY